MISCSRRTGEKSYEGVMRVCFGKPVELLTILLVFCICFLTPVAYLILLRGTQSTQSTYTQPTHPPTHLPTQTKGLMTPLVEAYITHAPLSNAAKQGIMAGIALCVTPLTASSVGAIGGLAIFRYVGR